MIHRDVKPTNILLAPDGRPVLGDLGLADIVDRAHRVSDTGELIGTPAYMAPEQASKEPASPRTDQYALAVVAYEMLTGRIPFRGATPREVVLAHRDQAATRPRSLNPQLGAATDEAMVKGLAKRPQDRYPTVSAFVDALRGASPSIMPIGSATMMDGPIIKAAPALAPAASPAVKRGAVAAAAAAGVLLAAALAGGYAVSHRQTSAVAAASTPIAAVQTPIATALVAVAATTAATTPATSGHQAAPCQLAPAFATLLAAIGDQSQVGSCTEDVGINPSNGDTVQHTARGLLAKSKLDNSLSFTDGYQAWVLGADGKAHHRLNTQRFSWEANPEGLPLAQ
jgi:hypothetical protein